MLAALSEQLERHSQARLTAPALRLVADRMAEVHEAGPVEIEQQGATFTIRRLA